MLVDTKPLFLLSRHHGDTSLSSQNRSPPDIRWSTIRSCCIPSSSATTHANHPLEADTMLVSFINPLAAGTSQVRRGTCLTQCRQKRERLPIQSPWGRWNHSSCSHAFPPHDNCHHLCHHHPVKDVIKVPVLPKLSLLFPIVSTSCISATIST